MYVNDVCDFSYFPPLGRTLYCQPTVVPPQTSDSLCSTTLLSSSDNTGSYRERNVDFSMREQECQSRYSNRHMLGYQIEPANSEVASAMAMFGPVDCNPDNGRVPLVFSHLEPTQAETIGITSARASVSTPCSRCICQNCSDIHAESESGGVGNSMQAVCETDSLSNGLESLTVSNTTDPSSTTCTCKCMCGQDQAHSCETRFPPAISEHGSPVSGDSIQWAWPCSHGTALSHIHGNGSCGGEALGVGYMEDVTVEDLAGYFDQMLHLPRPMSEMAQLMYT